MRGSLIFMATLMVLTAPMAADVIVLNDGARVVGEILEETKDAVKMKLKSGVVFTYERTNIKSVEKGRSTTGQTQGGGTATPSPSPSPTAPSPTSKPSTPSPSAPTPSPSTNPLSGTKKPYLERAVEELKAAKFTAWVKIEDIPAAFGDGKDGGYRLVKPDGQEEVSKERPKNGDGLRMIWIFQSNAYTPERGGVISGPVSYWWAPFWWVNDYWNNQNPEQAIYNKHKHAMEGIVDKVMEGKIPNWTSNGNVGLAILSSELKSEAYKAGGWGPALANTLKEACQKKGGSVGMGDLLFQYNEQCILEKLEQDPEILVKIAETKRTIVLQIVARK